MDNPLPDNPVNVYPTPIDWRPRDSDGSYLPAPAQHPPLKTLFIAFGLFFLTLCTCLIAGTQFAVAYANNQAVSFDEFARAFTLIYKNPAGLLIGFPFAVTLLGILLIHELGHFFACRHHRIRSSYPFFIPFPTLIGTLGAFILIRSPIRTKRALFDVGASGPLAGFIVAIPALMFGVLHAKVVADLADPAHAVVLGTPLILHFFAAILRPGISAGSLLLHPVGRAAWVGLFATALNLLPAAQLDGGHILRSLSPVAHRYSSAIVPIALMLLGFFHFWSGWYVWGALLFGIRFFRILPIYDALPLDPNRKLGALAALIVFILCFMPDPFSGL
ncbi:MAG TPA: site-2 protease family protein [Candidatus Acidoferrum sp.]